MAGALPGLGQSAHAENATGTRITITPTNATASFRTNSSGIAEGTNAAGTFTTRFTWLTGCGTNAQYWVRWTTLSGALSSGTAGSWLQMSTTRTWSRTRASVGTDTVTGTLEIALDSAGARVIASATITLTATMEI